MASTETPTAASLAIGISILALFVSGLTLAVNYAGYLEERALILKADFFEKKGFWSIVVQPVSKDSHFLIGEAFFPESLVNEPVKIDCTGEFRWMGTIQRKYEEIIIKRFQSKKGYTQIGEGVIPLLIRSYYAAHGKTYSDISLYYLDVMFTRGEDEEAASVTFGGLIFGKRLTWKELKVSIHKELDEMWNSKEGMYTPYREPSLIFW